MSVDSKYQNEKFVDVKKIYTFKTMNETTQLSTTFFDENSKDCSKFSFGQEYEFTRFCYSKIDAFNFAPEFETKCYVIHSNSIQFDEIDQIKARIQANKNKSSNVIVKEEQNDSLEDIYKDESLSEAFDSCLNDIM